MAGKQGATWSKPMTQQQRDSLALRNIEDLLDKQARGKKRLSSATLMALRIRYDKLRPALSSVEQTVSNEDDKLTEDQLIDKYSAVFTARPDLLQAIIARQARANPLVAVQQSAESEQSELQQSTGTEG